MKTLVLAFVLALGFAAVELRAQNEPNLIPDVVDPAKLKSFDQYYRRRRESRLCGSDDCRVEQKQ